MTEKAYCESSLYYFLRQAWPYIEGNVKFIPGWHIKAIADHLEACYRREILKLIINVPPRSGKSNLISVAFPAWVWIHKPEEKFLTASCTSSLSLEIAGKARRLIESSWYRENWGDRFQLLRDQNAKSYYENDKTGYRISTSVGSSTIGKGGDVLIADDLNNPGVNSSVQRENVKIWWDQVWSTRKNNPKTSVSIGVQQRVNESDMSGHVQKNDLDKECTYLILPNEFEISRKSRTFISNLPFWEDPRVKEGELLMPNRIGEKEVESLKKQLGSYGYAGQYQQRPSPEAGGIIKKSWFQWWKYSTPLDIEFTIQSWDTALTAKEMSAYSACTTWGVFYDHNRVENVILLSMWRDRVEYPELREWAKRLYFDYRDTGKQRNLSLKGKPLDVCVIEAKASGDPLIQDLHLAGVRAIGFNPTKYGDKIQRVRLITNLIEGGLVWLPAKGPTFDGLLPFADIFLESVACFPNAESRDLVDTMTQALLKLRDSRFLGLPRDDRPGYTYQQKVSVGFL